MSREPEWPLRPSIPPVLVALAVAIVLARVALWALKPEGGATLGPSAVWWAALATVGLLAGIRLVLRGSRHRAGPGRTGGARNVWVYRGDPPARRPEEFALALAFGSMAGLAIATTGLGRQADVDRTLASTPVSSLVFRVERDATPTETGWWTSAEVLADGRPLGAVWVSGPGRSFAGDRLRGVGRYEGNGDDEFGVSSRMRGISGTVTFATDPDRFPAQGLPGFVEGIRRQLVDAVDPMADPGRALVAGAALGDRSGLKAFGLDDDFSRAGLSHLVAVSGLHVTLATSLLAALLARTRCSRRVRFGCLAVWGALYVALCGTPVSAVRSLAMAGASQGADLAGRRAHPLGAVGAVGLVMVVADGDCVGDLGFLLSVVCVVALALLSRWCTRLSEALWPDLSFRRLRRRHRRRALELWRAGRRTLAASVVCLLASLPLVAASFGGVSILSPVANLVAAPLFEGFLPLALVAGLVGWVPTVGPVAVEATALLGRGLSGLVGWFGHLPWGQAVLSAGEPWATLAVPLVLAIPYILWPRPRRRQVRLALGLSIASLLGWWVVRPLLLPPRVVVLDVGQGDAILVQDGAHALLVDTGPDEAVAEALARQGVAMLDAVVFTHEHADHAGGLPALVGHATVGALFVPEGQGGCLSDEVAEATEVLGCPIVEVRRGDCLRVGRFRLTMLWPEGPEDGDENDECLVARLDYMEPTGRLRALLTGDAESDVLDELVDRGEVGDLDLLKVGHHGSEVSVDAEALEACSPEVAVASAGEGNSYGHPDPVCVDLCEGCGARFLCTKDVGDVEVRPGAVGPIVEVQHQASRGPTG